MTVDLMSRLDGTGITPLVPFTIPAGAPALSIGLFQPPAVYSYNGLAWDMSSEGTYIVATVAPVGQQNAGYYIVFASNVLEMMRALCFVTQHGAKDQGLTADENHTTGALWLARTRKIARTCGATVPLVAYACAKFGIPHRTVNLLTAEAPNGYDDGHVVSEVNVGGRWQLFDVDTKIRVLDSCGVPQSLAQVIDAGIENLTVEELSQPDCDQQEWSNVAFPYSVYFAMMFQTPALRAAWRRRVYQIPGIVRADGTTAFYLPPGTEGRGNWVLSLAANYRVESREAWLAEFYP